MYLTFSVGIKISKIVLIISCRHKTRNEYTCRVNAKDRKWGIDSLCVCGPGDLLLSVTFNSFVLRIIGS